MKKTKTKQKYKRTKITRTSTIFVERGIITT